MTKPLYRIYLAPDRFGHLQQTPRKTRDFYDIDINQSRTLAKARWYRIVQSSPGHVFSALWKASDDPGAKPVRISELGAFMQVISDLWYVDGRDVDLEQALDLNRSAFTKPRVLALSLALVSIAYVGMMNLFSLWSDSPLPEAQPLARFAGLTMLILLAVEQVLNGIKKWRQSQENW